MARPITESELVKLRKQVPLGSLFVADYRNALGVDEKAACDFFDSYLEFLAEIMQEDGIEDNAFWEHCGLYDTEESLIEWLYCFDECPLMIESEGE